jgi:hypothetical protein
VLCLDPVSCLDLV